jgi:hypothetical protein
MVSFLSASAPPVRGGPASEIDERAALDRLRSEYVARSAAAANPEAQRQLDATYMQIMQDLAQRRARGVFEALEQHVTASFTQIGMGVSTLSPALMYVGLHAMFIETPVALWQDHPWFTVLYGLFIAIVLAIGGGAIARMSAHQIATQQRISMREAFDYSLQRLPHMLTAQILPAVILGVLGAVIVVMGLLMAAPVMDVIGALLYGVALLLGFLMAFLLVGYFVCHPMLIPAVACESCSGPDAMQRGYAYAVTRPLHLVWYWLIGLIGLALGFLVVSLIAAVMLNVTAAMFGQLHSNAALAGAGVDGLFQFDQAAPVLPSANWHVRWAASIIGFWKTLVICLVAAYVLSYYFSASTIGYLLMRRVSDGQEIEEIWQPGMIPGTMMPITPPPAAAEPAPVAAGMGE